MKNLPFIPRLAAACAAALLLVTLPAAAQATASPPERMTYQGYLVDGNGEALGKDAPKNYDVIFRIWKSESSTASTELLWTEQQTVTVDKGYFSVLLGEGSNIGEPRPVLSTIFAGGTASERWVGITVKGIGSGGADADILPRLRLLSAPYAYLAQRAATVDGSALTSGTVADSRLSANVALRNVPNTFTGNQTFAAGSLILDNNQAILAKNTSGTPEVFVWPRYGDNVTYLNYGSGGLHIRNNASATRMFITDTGNIGIGMSSPGFPLNFSGSLGDKISLWGQSGNHFGFGIAPSTLEIHADVVGSDIAFGYGRSGAMSEVMRIKGSGNVGIGTRSPARRLQLGDYVNGSEGMIRMVSRSSVAGSGAARTWDIGVPQTGETVDGAGYSFVIDDTGTTATDFMVKYDSGYVGIGTVTPSAPLTIRNDAVTGLRVERSNGSYASFYRDVSSVYVQLNNSIHSSGDTFARYDGDQNWDFSSDVRLKKDIVDAEPMLDRAMQVQVRRFRWKSAGPDSKHMLGVIAQEVQPLFPDIVGECDHPTTHEKTLTVGYSDFGVVAIKALQELKARQDEEINELRTQVTQLAAANQALQARLEKIEAALAPR